MKKAKRNKEIKSLDLFKKGFRKNEIVIYAIALMLVTAGYFNYTANLDKNSVETSAQEVANSEQNDVARNQTKLNEIESNSNIAESQNKAQADSKVKSANESVEVSKTVEENKTENNKKDEDIGDAKLVNSNSVVEEDYFAATKLQRDTNYADMISTYTKILEDNSVSETQKSIAMKEITKINETKNAISICENLLSGKGFANYVVLVNADSVNVVVKVEGGLKKDKVAQIQNIIARELNSKIEDIHITEK